MTELPTLNDFLKDSTESINPYPTSIRVIGVGGAGNNTIDRLSRRGLKDIQTLALNTDAQHLLDIQADRKILIGRGVTAGLGSGGDPQIGERSAEESRRAILTVIEGTDLLFITGGLGGGTGTGSIPVIGKLAREQGTLTVAIVTMPFSEEGIIRWENAQVGLEKIKQSADTVIVLRNDKLLSLYPDLTLLDSFQKSDEILVHALCGLKDLVVKRGLINLDFADIRAVLTDGPSAVIGLGESNSENRAEEAARRAFSHPLIDADITGAQSALVHVSGGSDMTLKEAREAIRFLSRKLDPGARIIWGLNIDKALKHTVKVMLIVTGLKEKEDDFPQRVENQAAEPVSETGLSPEGYPFETAPAVSDTGKSIFDIKESIMASGDETPSPARTRKNGTQTSVLFYRIFEEEATSDLKRFDRAIHHLRENPDNRKALLDALQSCKLLHASSQMFGFDEISQLLSAIEEILQCIHSREIHVNPRILDSVTLAMELVVDLLENRTDGRGETGYIVDRLHELKAEQMESAASPDQSRP
jgi:cell division protein FtsZ